MRYDSKRDYDFLYRKRKEPVKLRQDEEEIFFTVLKRSKVIDRGRISDKRNPRFDPINEEITALADRCQMLL